MLQAGWTRALGHDSGLPGDTPGYRVELKSRRVSDIARCANLLSQGQTRWSAPLPYPPPSSSFLYALAASLLGGDFTVEAAVARLTHTLGRSWPWLRPLARRYLKAFAPRTRPRNKDVIGFLRHDAKLLRAWQRHHRRLAIVHWVTEAQQMRPVPGVTGWQIPAILSPQALADWLLADPSELLWYADLKGLERNSAAPRLRHYHYHLALKPSGGLRLLEAPKGIERTGDAQDQKSIQGEAEKIETRSIRLACFQRCIIDLDTKRVCRFFRAAGMAHGSRHDRQRKSKGRPEMHRCRRGDLMQSSERKAAAERGIERRQAPAAKRPPLPQEETRCCAED